MPRCLQLGFPQLPSQVIPSALEVEEALQGGSPALLPKGTAKGPAVPQSNLETTRRMELALTLRVLLKGEMPAHFQHFDCSY